MKVSSIHTWLTESVVLLKQAGSTSPRLDSEMLLAHALDKDRAWLVAHSENMLTEAVMRKANALLKRRMNREPVAYLTGTKEFYGREFFVTPNTLIPRPETEDLVELSLSCLKEVSEEKVMDAGTGSGCIGITLKLERPRLNVTLTDIDSQALDVAKKNAKQLGAKVTLVQSDLLTAFSKIQNPKSKIYFDLIVANLPYVDRNWQRSPETDHEPALALFADDNGLQLIKQLIDQAQFALKPGGNFVLEADPAQHSAIIQYAKKHQLLLVETQNYGLRLRLLERA